MRDTGARPTVLRPLPRLGEMQRWTAVEALEFAPWSLCLGPLEVAGSAGLSVCCSVDESTQPLLHSDLAVLESDLSGRD
ncbi:hypothetical protein Ddc_04742 [Ditylenchus destructor]|nr:hypothetical protein Ddc_04742 [Ditylenchus destructor]